ncbi:hypothetical protein K432DRAFT_307848 [Lepidopterella palustris CBS 459.81]|uniref:PHD-type domain-containing protein n=1 Tax=Lepidopterella palustris CBS 459.81 TaxID=1314670 RepID=A0A8E2E1P8_9PEZI|nr:hypothetical protein K432DRAFT_307848 [Lepidopterella palustris CBS 459.81]
MTPQPPSNPDAQTTVNDFLDYTEFFPSDLVRSLTLIGKLDARYLDTTQRVHELTKTYGNLPKLPVNERPDPIALRKEISSYLDQAIYFRESTFAEAARLNEVAERHSHRLAIIKRKLQALPQPPSRDPTPAPVSPQATRSLNRNFERTPRLHLHFEGSRQTQASSTARPRDYGRKSTIPHASSPTPSSATEYDESTPGTPTGSVIGIRSQKGIKIAKPQKNKVPKTPRIRPPGVMGTNVHSSVAGISTSNALAKLSPPPSDAKPGSRFAPWFKLTEYEMAVLRKQMKKNAIWSPSDTMIRRELQKKGRGREAYERERARCDATGEPLLDEEAVDRSNKKGTNLAPGEISSETWAKEDSQLVNRGMKLNEAKKLKKESLLREQAMRDAMEIEDASRKVMEAGNMMKNLFFNHGTRESVNVTPAREKKEATKSLKKRKRDPSPEALQIGTPETSLASQESVPKPTGPKRIKITPPVPPVLAPAPPTPQPILLAPAPASAILPAPVPATVPVTAPAPALAPTFPIPTAHIPSTIKTTTVQVPLAPAGPATPPVPRASSKASSRKPTPALPSPTENKKPTTDVQPPQTTAATSRPRRASVAPKAPSPAPAPAPAPAPEPVEAPPTLVNRPRSSRGVPTPKAASAEPPTASTVKPRDLRRASNVSLPAAAQPTTVLPTRASARRRPPPSGTVTAGEDGKGKVSVVKRTTGSKGKKKAQADKKAEEEPIVEEPIDPDEPRYCICGDVSFGTMVACENEECEKEWFHLDCVGLTEIPPRRSKWYCPECRVLLNVDEKGNAAPLSAASNKRSSR